MTAKERVFIIPGEQPEVGIDGYGKKQGRRHGFESGEDKFCERSEQKIFFDPPRFLASGGTKYCLDS